MNKFSMYLQSISGSGLLNAMNSLVSSVENEEIFAIAYHKSIISIDKKKYFFNNKINKCFVVDNPTNLGNVSLNINEISIELISEDVLIGLANDGLSDISFLRDAVVLLTNNNLAKINPILFANIYSRTPHTIFAIHDYDNHHWHEMSLYSSILSDIYVPAHMNSLNVASRINSNILLGVPCGTIQWKRDFLIEHFPDILTTTRSDSPFGMHSYYPKFKYRNRVIATIGSNFPKVGLLSDVTNDYHHRTPEDRWNEWISHKFHWIAPVFNDLPIRFFDTLLTGGIPLVPSEITPYLNTLNIPNQYYEVYTASDIMDSTRFIDKIRIKYSNENKDTIIHRFLFTLDNFHVDNIIRNIVCHCKSVYEHNID